MKAVFSGGTVEVFSNATVSMLLKFDVPQPRVRSMYIVHTMAHCFLIVKYSSFDIIFLSL